MYALPGVLLLSGENGVVVPEEQLCEALGVVGRDGSVVALLAAGGGGAVACLHQHPHQHHTQGGDGHGAPGGAGRGSGEQGEQGEEGGTTPGHGLESGKTEIHKQEDKSTT